MNKEELNQYVDYKDIYENIRDQHLYEYPTANDFIKKYYVEDVGVKTKNMINQLYDFLLSEKHDEYLNQLDVDCESSIFNIKTKEVKICLANIDDSNSECGYEVNSVISFTFIVDTEYDCFKSFMIED